MPAQPQWLQTIWPTVRSYLPPPPAVTVEIGCGPLGGFVPNLRSEGYDAIGIDPAAPEGESYRRVEFERSDLRHQLNGVIACTSLHHVADPCEVLDKVVGALTPDGVMIVIEWDWEGFDESTARWCFERLGPERQSWLHHRRESWQDSDQAWEPYFRGWAEHHGLHPARRLLRELDLRFERVACDRGPYYFPELSATSEAEELEAIGAGLIRPGRIDYVGRLR